MANGVKKWAKEKLQPQQEKIMLANFNRNLAWLNGDRRLRIGMEWIGLECIYFNKNKVKNSIYRMIAAACKVEHR